MIYILLIVIIASTVVMLVKSILSLGLLSLLATLAACMLLLYAFFPSVMIKKMDSTMLFIKRYWFYMLLCVLVPLFSFLIWSNSELVTYWISWALYQFICKHYSIPIVVFLFIILIIQSNS